MSDAETKVAEDQVGPPPNLGKIEDVIPQQRVRTKYPWPEMKAGQSVVQPAKASSSARAFVTKHRPGWKVLEEAVEGYPGYVRIGFIKDPDQEEIPVDQQEIPGGLNRDEAAEEEDSFEDDEDSEGGDPEDES